MESSSNLVLGCAVIKDLCRHICKGLPDDEIKKMSRDIIIQISSTETTTDTLNYSFSELDERSLCQKIEQQLCILNKKEDIFRFNQLYRKLKRSESQKLLKNRCALISFLLQISESRNGKRSKDPSFERPKYSLRSKFTTPVSHKGSGDGIPNRLSIAEGQNAVSSVSVRPSSFVDSSLLKKGSSYHSNVGHDLHKRRTPTSADSKGTSNSYRGSPDSLSHMSSPRFMKCSKFYASEVTVLNELIYCFQGVGGNVLKLDVQHGFIVDPQVRIQHSSLVERLIELGYLHNRVSLTCKELHKGGSVALAVEAGIRKQLTNYYGFVGCMHSELIQSGENNDDTPLREEYSDSGSQLTLRRLLLWASDPLRTMQSLCDALTAVVNKRGGGILNALDRLRHHGDPRYQSTIQTLFDYAGKPVMSMIKNWVVKGELYDPHDEFFITTNTSCQDRDIWRDKFILRTSMIPNVITLKLADTILRSGKAIHFLNVICEQRVPVRGMRQKLQNIKEADLLDLTDPRSRLSIIVNGIFEETSQLVLETLVNNFKLFQHFQGLRRYILLGQGDFANYFMELVEPEMRKPASELRYHELMGLLGSAVRSTTAAYEDPEIMKRVSVKLLVASGGDWGSDVFGLQYIMHDPLDAAFGLSEGAYSHMFNFLWRTKRMEYILFSMRKKHWAIKNKLSWLAEQIPEVNSALVLADRLSQELVHFARQFHYYILFEVVECLWEKFSCALQKSSSLDDIISAHSIFIRDIQAQTFQDEASRKFINELRLIWDLVFELEVLENDFLSRVEQECEDREEREKRLSIEGTSYEEMARFEEKNKKLKTFLTSVRAKYSIIIKNYQDVLKKFLLELPRRKDYQLRMLCARIDFNEHYKKSDARLMECMKFSRCGNLFD